MLIFAVQLSLLPTAGSETIWHLILPAITLGTSGAGTIARFRRSAVLETLEQPYMRAARGMALSALERGYVSAVRSYGAGPVWLYWRHILPNVVSALIVNATLNFPQTTLLESSLSFLGLDIQPPMTSLGNMLGYGREYLLTAWWIAVIPGVAISLTALAVSILGDELRDRLDPMLADKRAI